jgi:ABC-type multidrug transport system permease subunit
MNEEAPLSIVPRRASGFVNWRQASILTSRYLDVIWGDKAYTLLLLAQAPIIAALIALRFNKAPETESLYFCLVLGAIWLGCVNACREIAKEQTIYQRERLAGLDIGAYVWSKTQVLTLLAVVQCALLLGIVAHWVTLHGSLVAIFLCLLAAAVAGTALGLAISAWAKSSDVAVGLVPVVMFPQILFSKFVLPERFLEGIARYIEQATITKWSYEMLAEIAARHQEVDWGAAFSDFGILGGIAVALLLLTGLLLKMREW